jgi:hypothetical protein
VGVISKKQMTDFSARKRHKQIWCVNQDDDAYYSII